MTTVVSRRVCPERLTVYLFMLCTVTYIVALLGRLSYSAVMAELIVREGFTKSSAGLVGTALFASYGICQVFSGFLGDRTSPRCMVFVGTFGSACINLTMGLADDLHMMLVLWVLNGAFQSFIWSPISRIFAEIMPPSSRKRACANIGFAYPVATICIYLLASILLRWVHWRAVFLASGALMVLAALWWNRGMGFCLRMTERHGGTETVELSAVESGESGNLLKLLLISGAICAVFGALSGGLLRDGIQSWVPSLMTERFGLSTSLSILLAILLPTVNMGGVILTKYLAQNVIKNEMRGAVGFYLVCIGFLALLIPAGTSNALLSLVLLTCASTAMVGSNSMYISFMPMHFGAIGKSSSVTGVLNCACYAGSAISSYGIGKISEYYGWNAAILAWLGFALAACAVTALGVRKWGKYRRSHL